MPEIDFTDCPNSWWQQEWQWWENMKAFYARSGVVYCDDFCQLFSSSMGIFMLSEGDSVH